MDLLSAATSTWAVIMALSPALQIRAMLETKSSRDVSIGYFAVLVIGFGLWVAYGWREGDPVLYVPNSIAALVALATITLALYLRRRPAS